MPDIDKEPDFLNDNERVMWFGRPRLITYFKWFVFLIAFSILVGIINSPLGLMGVIDSPISLLGFIDVPTDLMAFLIGLVTFLIGLAIILTRWRGHKFWITNQRGIKEFTWITRDVTETPNKQVTNTRVSQGILGRIFSFGSVFLDTAGGPGEEIKFLGIPNPRETSNEIFEVLKRAKSQPMPTDIEEIGEEEDSMDKLEKLNKLRKEGAISEEEFENKKKEILDDI